MNEDTATHDSDERSRRRSPYATDCGRAEENPPPPFNFCARCGAYCGDGFTGYAHDRFSNRGALWCDRCVSGQTQAEGEQS